MNRMPAGKCIFHAWGAIATVASWKLRKAKSNSVPSNSVNACVRRFAYLECISEATEWRWGTSISWFNQHVAPYNIETLRWTHIDNGRSKYLLFKSKNASSTWSNRIQSFITSWVDSLFFFRTDLGKTANAEHWMWFALTTVCWIESFFQQWKPKTLHPQRIMFQFHYVDCKKMHHQTMEIINIFRCCVVQMRWSKNYCEFSLPMNKYFCLSESRSKLLRKKKMIFLGEYGTWDTTDNSERQRVIVHRTKSTKLLAECTCTMYILRMQVISW